tara:strand:+ start:1194 stop:1673 length:480 start_codon:yes stop_codon:yes gene_type:complete
MSRGKSHPNTGLYASLEQPKPLEAHLTEKEYNFIVNLVDNHMEPKEAFFEAGYTATKSSPANRSKRLQRHLWKHIEKRIEQKVSETATLALSVLENLMRGADSENVKLNAARDILSRAGYDAVQKQETTIKEVSELTEDELDEQIAMLSNVVKLSDAEK